MGCGERTAGEKESSCGRLRQWRDLSVGPRPPAALPRLRKKDIFTTHLRRILLRSASSTLVELAIGKLALLSQTNCGRSPVWIRLSPPIRRPLAAALCLSAVFFPVAGQARQTISIPTPFEVGGSSVGNYLSALVAGADRDTIAAATFFREALRADPTNAELIERTFVASLSNGDITEGADLARRLVARDPKNSLGHLVLGVEQFKAKHYVAARRQFSQGAVGQERDVTAALLTAWTYAGQGDEKKALATLDGIRDSSFALFKDYHAGLIADLANDVPEATRRMKAAYASDKTILRLVDAYGRFFDRHGDVAEAQRAYTEFDKLMPRHPIVLAALADIKAGKTLAPLIKTPEDGAAEVLYGLGAAGGRQGDELAAMVYLRLSLYLAPQNALATVTLADIFGRLKQNEQAIDVYESVPESSPLRSNADIQTGLTLDTLGRPDDAIAHLEGILKDRPNDLDALTTLGNVQREQKRFADAAATYTKALALLSPTDKAAWPLLYFRGIANERLKKFAEEEADFKQALEIVPDQPLVLNYLGYSWIDRGLHLDEAFKMLRRAVALRPEDGYIVDSLGWAHYKLGEYDDAVKELERAVTLKPSDPTINDHLGDAYWRTGRKLEATFQWNHARDLKPDPEDLPAIVKKIADGLPDLVKPTTAAVTPMPVEPAPATSSPATPAPEPAVVTPAPIAPAPAMSAPAVPAAPAAPESKPAPEPTAITPAVPPASVPAPEPATPAAAPPAPAEITPPTPAPSVAPAEPADPIPPADPAKPAGG